MTARNELQAKKAHITTLRGVLLGLMVIIYFQYHDRSVLQAVQRIYIPPDLRKMVETRVNEPTPPTIYDFTYHMMQSVYRWRKDGATEFETNIFNYGPFFTESCRGVLDTIKNKKFAAGELAQRKRTIEEIEGRSYVEDRVEVVGTNTRWKVWLDLNIVEHIGSTEVKNIDVQWPVSVVKLNVEPDVNPWGLAVDCQPGEEPILLNEKDLAKPFMRKVL